MELYEDLVARGLIHQITDPKAGEYLNQKKLTVYSGIDPTSDSLHVGHLLGLVTLRRLQKAGHKIIALVGGATGAIGDPSGKTQERQLLTPEQIDRNVEGISLIISRFLDLRSSSTLLLNNLDWFKDLSIVEFLRDVGKHFTVNYMIAKDSVQSRLQDREHGLSFTEFTYMIFQAYDFYYLNQKYDCTLQVGGADQWGNITAGIELIRRKAALQKGGAEPVFAITWPLVTKADGTKFGKTESGTIWLSSDKTKIYDFYQFFLRTQDKEVIQFLNYFTFLPLEEIQRLQKTVEVSPEKREAQNVLAREMTVLVHGEEEYQKVQKASSSLFTVDFSQIDAESLEELVKNAPSTTKPRNLLDAGISIVDLLVEVKLVSSKGQARNDIQGGGIYLNNQRVDDVAFKVGADSLVAGRYMILRKGKKNYHTIIYSGPGFTSN